MTIKQLYPTQRPALDLNFARQKRLDSRVTFTRGSTATYVGSDGLIKTAAANEARFDHDSATGESLGLLIEESRTNVVLNSSNPTWNTLNSGTGTLPTITAVSDAAPDGTTNSVQRFQFDRGAGNTVADFSLVSYAATVASAFYSNTLWMKSNDANSYTVQMYDPNGGIGNEFVVTPTWQRFSIDGSTTFKTSNHTATTDPRIVFGLRNQPDYNSYPVGNTNSQTADILAWGPQIEAGSFPTSYIPTSGSTVTRSADVASMTGTNFSSWYNQSEGTFLSQLARLGSPTTGSIGAIIGGSNPNVTSSSRHMLIGNGNAQISSSGGASYGFGLSAVGFHRLVNAYKLNDFNAAYDGNLLTADTSYTPPTCTQLVFAGVFPIANNTGRISRLTYYPTRLSDTQLQALTL